VVIERESEANAFFKKVIDSQRAFCEKTVAFHLEGNTPKEPAYEHFFGTQAVTADSTIL
jgi:hypothetical protein